jgi:hypothetical protein
MRNPEQIPGQMDVFEVIALIEAEKAGSQPSGMVHGVGPSPDRLVPHETPDGCDPALEDKWK